MNKLKILTTFALLLLLVLGINSVSAYSHTTFEVSDRITYTEDIKGENRGFSLKRSSDVSRLTGPYGYYDWSYRPNVNYPRSDSYRISDRLALQAFSTFQQDSQAQNRLELERERNRHRFGFFGRRYGGYGYGGYGYSRSSYGSYYRYGF